MQANREEGHVTEAEGSRLRQKMPDAGFEGRGRGHEPRNARSTAPDAAKDRKQRGHGLLRSSRVPHNPEAAGLTEPWNDLLKVLGCSSHRKLIEFLSSWSLPSHTRHSI